MPERRKYTGVFNPQNLRSWRLRASWVFDCPPTCFFCGTAASFDFAYFSERRLKLLKHRGHADFKYIISHSHLSKRINITRKPCGRAGMARLLVVWRELGKLPGTSIAARGGGGSFKRLKLYNSEEHLPIESFVTTLIH